MGTEDNKMGGRFFLYESLSLSLFVEVYSITVSLSLSLLKFIVLHALELNERVKVTATKIITVIISGTTSLLRIANRLVMDSYCRGGILRTRGGRTYARHEE